MLSKWPFLFQIYQKGKKGQVKLKNSESTYFVLFKKGIHSLNNIQPFL
jgi:hypothetical protein